MRDKENRQTDLRKFTDDEKLMFACAFKPSDCVRYIRALEAKIERMREKNAELKLKFKGVFDE